MRSQVAKWALLVVIFGLCTLWIVSTLLAMFEPVSGKVPTPISIHTLTLQPAEIDLKEELPGRVISYRSVDIRPQVSGKLLKCLFIEGKPVSKGELLYQIDSKTYQAAVDEAQGKLRSAEALIDSVTAKSGRLSELAKIDAVSLQDEADTKAQLAQAHAEVDAARAALERAKIDLERTQIYASEDGWVGKSLVRPGDLLTANQSDPLVRLLIFDKVYVDLVLASEKLAKYPSFVDSLYRREQFPVALHIDSGSKAPSSALFGQFEFSNMELNNSTSSLTLRILYPNADLRLLPNLFVRGVVTMGKITAFRVPQDAVIRRPDGKAVVWLVDDTHQVHSQIVTILRAEGNHWVITEGLTAGAVIATDGFQKFSEGLKLDF